MKNTILLIFTCISALAQINVTQTSSSSGGAIAYSGTSGITVAGAVIFPSGTNSVAVTYTGNQTYNGTSNTAPNQTASSGSSLMTRDLTDVRYGRVITGYVATNTVVTSNTTYSTVLTATVPDTGTYQLQSIVPITSTGTGGGKTQIVGGTATISGGRGLYVNDATTQSGQSNICADLGRSWTGYTGLISRTGYLTVSAGGTVLLQFAQFSSDATASTLLSGGYIILTKIN